MPVEGYWNAVNRIVRVALGDGAAAVARYRATAWITDASDGNALHREVTGGDTFDFSAIAGGVVQADHVAHGAPLLLVIFWVDGGHAMMAEYVAAIRMMLGLA